MRAVDIIIKKRDGLELTCDEIDDFVQGFTRGEIPDYQAAAWAMAVLFRGMTDQETTNLTLSMARSGEQLNLNGVVPIAVDKHSTGGVGDKTSLVVEPLVAACGLAVGKMSGRGLGFSGGTIDKLESIHGFRTNLSRDEFISQLKRINLVLTGQSSDLAPADGKLYALRDVTGTVPSIPLIASSIMSKKIAAGAQAIVLDVKVGVGAFMTTLEEAQKLARLMVQIGALSGRKVIALISDMNQPLGNAIGNALEVHEAIRTLNGTGPADFTEHCLVVASHMLRLGGRASSLEGARKMVEKALSNGQAWKSFRLLVEAQGGDLDSVDHPEKLPQAGFIRAIHATQGGFLHEVNARTLGEAAVVMGAGRMKKSDPIDHAVGMMVHCKVGDRIEFNDPLVTIYSRDETQFKSIQEGILAAFQINPYPCQALPLFYGIIE